jgi:hypothetical protein
MRKLLKFICDQQLEDYNELPRLKEPLKERFDVRDHNGNEATAELLNTVVWWEQHPEIWKSLEEILNEKYIVKENCNILV